MKWPEKRKERIQIFVLMGLVGVAILYGGLTLGLRPMLQARKARRAKIEELQSKIREAQKYLDLTSGNPEKNHEVLSKITDFSHRYFLTPRLGDNYLLGVTEMVEEWSQTHGLKLSTPTEVGRVAVPYADPSGSSVHAYSFTVNPSGGLHDLIRLLRAMEQSSPSLTVTRLSIMANPKNPLEHAMTLVVQGPVWDKHHERTAALAAELESSAKLVKKMRGS